MRVAILSDIHVEYTHWEPPNNLDVDLVICAGDVHDGPFHSIKWLKQNFRSPILFVPGNHEFYGSEYNQAKTIMAEAAVDTHVTYLDQQVFIGEFADRRFRFIGSTLWTDYTAYEKRDVSKTVAMEAAVKRSHDYEKIKYREDVITANFIEKCHITEKEWLVNELAKPFDGETVVITHFAPVLEAANVNYPSSNLTPHFVNDMEELILNFSPDIWIFGHTHYSIDMILGKTRLISNQMSKSNDRSLDQFNETLSYQI